MFFNLFGNSNQTSSAGDAHYSDDILAGHMRELSYTECGNIFRYFHLGKRIVSALPNFVMSVKRNILIDEAPKEVIERFIKTSDKLQIDKKVKQAVVLARIYGMAGIYISIENQDNTEPLTLKQIREHSTSLNIVDAQALSGTQINQEPQSVHFNKAVNICLNSIHNISPKRLHILTNDLTQYLRFTNATNTYSPPSIYQNMANLIPVINRSVIALDRLATKAGGIIIKTKDTAIGSGLITTIYKKLANLVRLMQNDGVAVVDKNSEIELFNLNGVAELEGLKNALNSDLLMALSDTPSAILLDKNLAQGFADGTEDMKAILMAADNFRELYLTPAYDFVDSYIMAKAWDLEFIKEIKKAYPDLYSNMGLDEIFNLWQKNFKFEYGNLYPNTENEEIDIKLKKAELMDRMLSLGIDRYDVEDEINNQNIMSNEVNIVNDRVGYDGSKDFSANSRVE